MINRIEVVLVLKIFPIRLGTMPPVPLSGNDGPPPRNRQPYFVSTGHINMLTLGEYLFPNLRTGYLIPQLEGVPERSDPAIQIIRCHFQTKYTVRCCALLQYALNILHAELKGIWLR
ncbi:hypothetical protein D3C75_910960 [compost metagenome]